MEYIRTLFLILVVITLYLFLADDDYYQKMVDTPISMRYN